ncbi:MAG: nucleotidyltransferase family protein [Gemmatimonadota bacterium]
MPPRRTLQFVLMGPTVDEKLAPGTWFAGTGRPAEGAVWPRPDQELLLHAALSRGDEAVAAWRRWADEVDLDALDPGAGQILPLAYRNLVDQGVQDERLAALKRRYAFTWAQNQRMFRMLGGILRLLHAAGIETLVFKGAALVPLYYRDGGVRGMGDVDVLVRPERFHEAARALGEAGWGTHFWSPELFDTRFEHALAFFDAADNSVDLHCHLLMACCERDADLDFWEASRPLQVDGMTTRTLCATDHLVQACVHGLNWVRVPPIRWVADAITVLRAAPDDIDWDRLELLAREREIALPTGAALAYLNRAFATPVPDETMRRLEAIPVSRGDRLRFGVWMENARGRPLALILHHWAMFSRGVRGAGPLERVHGLRDYLRFWAHTDRVWKVPVVLTQKGLRVVGHRLGLYRYWDA